MDTYDDAASPTGRGPEDARRAEMSAEPLAMGERGDFGALLDIQNLRPRPEVLTRYDGTAVLDRADEIGRAYADVFTQPPWNKAHDKGSDVVMKSFCDRLGNDARRPGFRAIVAGGGDFVEGFATGWVTPSPYPKTRAYPKVAVSIGAEAVARLLVGAIEVDELAVRPEARGRGLAGRLLRELTADAPSGRAWLLTWTGAPEAVEFYRRIGWHRVPPLPGRDNDIVTFLAPGHPGAVDLG